MGEARPPWGGPAPADSRPATASPPEPVDYQSLRFDYRRHPDQDAATPVRHPVVVVGAGPIGLAFAIDMAQRGQRVLLLDNDNTLSTGSRAICFAKRTLEVFDRLGCAGRMVDKGVSWKLGRVFFKDQQVYQFDLLPEAGHERPAFINLQQYYVEGYLAERAAELSLIDIRWNNKVVGIEPRAEGALLEVETPEGNYRLQADYVVACDGSRSSMRQMLGLEAKGRIFHDHFLIADVTMEADLPTERRFWFDPPFHPGQSALLHKQSDGVWRMDFQLGWDSDPAEERKHEKIIPRVRALLASIGHPDTRFEIAWASVYTFACQRMEHFRHGRVLFAGDSAHGVSPFGARGANSGVQDADNLAWKLAAVLRGEASEALLDSYASEREQAADENILNSTRSTDFITPKSEVSRLFRNAVLELSKKHAFARAMVNSGRLSLPTVHRDSPLNTPDGDAFAGRMVPGAPAADAPLANEDGSPGWLLRAIGARPGAGATVFTALVFGSGEEAERSLQALSRCEPPIHIVRVGARGGDEIACERYDARPGTVYLLRPDQHVCARWRHPTPEALRAACNRALAKD